MQSNKPLYKYIDREYALNFIRKGEILFKSLYYFQQFCGEKYNDKVRGDDNEGIITFDLPENEDPLVQTLEGEVIPVIKGSSRAYQEINDPACHYICCLSNSDNEDLYKDFKTNYRIKILDRNEFFKRLKNSSKYLSRFFIAKDVIYTNSVPYSENHFNHIIFYKNKYYNIQDEFRLYTYIPTKPKVNFHFEFTIPEGTEMRGLYSEILFKIGNIQDIAILEKKIQCMK